MILKLFFLPVKAVAVLGEKIQEEAERELYDTGTIQRQLVNLYSLYENGAISEDAYETEEQELMQRYQIAKQRELVSLQESDDLLDAEDGQNAADLLNEDDFPNEDHFLSVDNYESRFEGEGDDG